MSISSNDDNDVVGQLKTMNAAITQVADDLRWFRPREERKLEAVQTMISRGLGNLQGKSIDGE